jgi:hypothetical protein
MPVIISDDVDEPRYPIMANCGETQELTDDEIDDYTDCGCGQGTDCCGNRHCEACHDSGDESYFEDEDDGYGGVLNYYSYTPDPLIFYGGDKGAAGVPFYGMEIEITCNSRETMRWAKSAFNKGYERDNLVYLKSDGSVAGFEAVTHPMTYPWALDNFPWDVLPELKAKGCTIRPSDNGIHVHVSRTGFDSDAHTLRWFKLLYRNQADVIRCARRETTWARFSPDHRRGQFAHLKAQKGMVLNGSLDAQLTELDRQLRTEQRVLQRRPEYSFINRVDSYDWTATQRRAYEEYEREYRRISDRYRRQMDTLRRRRIEDTTARERYAAINTTNAHTFEVRLFASTLDVATAQSTIGLVSATVEYARTLSSADIIKRDGLTWPKFTEWLDGQPLYAAVRHANTVLVTGTRARSTI